MQVIVDNSSRLRSTVATGLVRELVLTPRQSEILSLVALGLSDKQIASHLGISHRTIRTHLERLFREYGFRSRTAAVAAWLRGKHRRNPHRDGTVIAMPLPPR